MAEEKLKFAVLGYGSIGRRHCDNLYDLGYEVQVYDPKYPSIHTREEILNWADAVLVCSPSGNHAQDMMDVVELGKHCFVEKPFGYDCPELLEGYLRGARARWGRNLIIATGFNLRFHECVSKANGLLSDGVLGEIWSASFSVLQKSEKPEYLRDGVIRNWACHEMDLAAYLLGEMEVVEAYADQNSEGKDQTMCSIDMRISGIRGVIRVNADYTVEPQERFFWIKGKEGTLYVNLLQRSLYVEWTDRERPALEFRGTGSFDKDYKIEMLYFARSCELQIHQQPLAYGEEGVENLYTIMKARELARVT